MDYAAAEPHTLRAGDSVTWTRETPEHSAADGWSLKYRLLYTSGSAVNITTSGAGTRHTASLTSAQTAAWPAGAGTLAAILEKGSGETLQRVTLESQPITILPDLSTAATFDGRSQAVKALADARAALADYMASGRLHWAGYDIAGRSVQFRGADEIKALIEHYEAQVSRENAMQAVMAGGSPGRVNVRM